MKERRWPWVISGLALVLAAGTGAVATYLWWLPCRGRMLVGTAYGPRYSDALLGDACIDRMNEGTPFPLPTPAALTAPGLLALSTLTMILVAVAWLVPVLFERMSPGRRLAAVVPALGVLVLALLGAGITYQVPAAEGLAYALAPLINVLVLVGLGAVIGAVRARVRFVVAAIALGSMGFAGPVVEYMIMVHWSDASWDAPPGSGYLTAALLLICGVAVLIMTALSRQPRPASPATATEQVEQVDPVA